LGLTSSALVVLLALIVIAALAGTLWWWPRLAGPGLRTVAMRAAALCVLQASVISLIFVVANRSAEFYASWSDLFGTDQAGGAIVAVGFGPSQAVVPVRITSSAPVPVPGQRKAPSGVLEAVQIHGELSGLTAPGFVYLPPQSAKSGTKAGPLPVVVVISDRIANPGAGYGAQQLADTAASEIAAGRLRPVIMVMLPARAGGAADATDQGCLDVPGGAQAGTFFSQDLPQALGSTYRVDTAPGGWALLGDSSGGYCAMQLAISSSQVFSVAAAPPARYAAPPGFGEFGGSPQIQAQDDLLWRLQHQPMQPISVLFVGPGQRQPFLSLVRAPMRAAAISPGAGKWPLAPVLDWIGRTMEPQP
jgi:hypothetical protein